MQACAAECVCCILCILIEEHPINSDGMIQDSALLTCLQQPCSAAVAVLKGKHSTHCTFCAAGVLHQHAVQPLAAAAGPAPSADPGQNTSACALPTAASAHSLHLQSCTKNRPMSCSLRLSLKQSHQPSSTSIANKLTAGQT